MSPFDVDIADVKPRLDELLARARAGEEIVLSESARPVAKLLPTDEVSLDRDRGFGMYQGRIWMSGDFDAPLSSGE